MNKQELEKLSDSELNVEVCRMLWKDKQHEDIVTYLGDKISANVIVKTGFEGYIFDYCNNPSDIMPEAFKRKLGFTPWENGSYLVSWYDPVEEIEYFSCSQNAYRSAAIVIILMEQDK